MLNIVPGQSKHDAIAAYLGGRGIKFLANGLRPIFYLHYWLFPNQRFLLRSSVNKPIGSASSKAKAHSKAIPKIVCQTIFGMASDWALALLLAEPIGLLTELLSGNR